MGLRESVGTSSSLAALIVAIALAVARPSLASDLPIDPMPTHLRAPSSDTMTRDTAELLEVAATHWALRTGSTPGLLTSALHLPPSSTVIDLMPHGFNTLNPYMGALGALVDGSAAHGGEIGYAATSQSGHKIGFVLSGATGADGAWTLLFYRHVIVFPPEGAASAESSRP